MVRLLRDQHDFQRLGGGQQKIRRVQPDAISRAFRHIAMPQPYSATDQRAVLLEAWLEIVQQRFDRAQVQHTEAAPVLMEHA